MTRVGRAVEKGETQGFMKVVVDAETTADPGRGDPRRRRRRGHPRHPGRHVGQSPVHHAGPHHAHPPDRLRADTHDAAGDVAAAIAGVQAAGSAPCCRHGVRAAFVGMVRPTRIRRRCAAEDRAVLVMCAPVAQSRRPRPEIACRTGRLDGVPDRHQRLLEAQQLGFVGGVVQQLAVGQIDQPQPASAARPASAVARPHRTSSGTSP